MRIDTEKILSKLSGTQSITEFLEESKDLFDLLSIGEYIQLEIESRNITKAKVIKESVQAALELEGIDTLGLTCLDRNYLNILQVNRL